MSAGAFTLYSKSVLAMSKGSFNLSSDTYVVTLHTNSYTPAANTDALWSDVSATELSTASGYTAGGVTLASETDTLTTATVTFTATSPSWASFSAGPFRYAVVTRRASGSLVSGDLLLCYSDLTGSGTITGSGGTYTITISGSGIFTITHSP
ncbi:MAG: hypothetical protein V4564_07740 [Pseudomonadota bacterium]